MSQPNGLSERLAQILDALQEPFPSAYIEWKPQSVSKDGSGRWRRHTRRCSALPGTLGLGMPGLVEP